MFADLLLRATSAGDALITPDATTSWPALRATTASALDELRSLRASRVAVLCEPSPETFAILAALDALGAEAILVDDDLLTDRELLDAIAPSALVRPSPDRVATVEPIRDAAAAGVPGIVILTSGTTGQPKAVHRTWPSLAADVRLPPTSDQGRWASGYRLRVFASMQVVLHAWMGGGVLVAGARGAAADVAEFWAGARAQCASATPSFWRWLLLGADGATLARIPLRQVTMGGEVADQLLLDRLHLTFPGARLTHIYATTESGRCLAVSDGQAGFPDTLLGAEVPTETELRIDAGELLVRRARAAGEWTRTGDLVRVENHRVFFAGRTDDVLNVAGHKVTPLQVEHVLRQVPGVADVRVFGQRSSLAGMIVACEIVPAAGADPEEVRAAVVEYARQRLTPAQQPRLVDIVDRVRLSAAGKSLRSRSGGS